MIPSPAAAGTVAELLDALERAGIVLALAEGGRLRWSAPAGAMTPEFLALLRRRKGELIARLAQAEHEGASAERTPPPTQSGEAPAAAGDAVEDRAAILEYDASLPRPWAEGAARLLAGLPPPRGCAPWRWAQVCDDAAGLVAGGWAARAAALGWDAAELFGAMPGVPDARYDAQGLAWLLRGQPVLDLDAAGASIRTPGGGALRFYRRHPQDRDPSGSVPAWDLAATDDGSAPPGAPESEAMEISR